MMAIASDRVRLGDRVEQAIEERADVEGEIARGAAKQQPRSTLKRRLFWLVVTGISLYLVAPSVLEVLKSWRSVEDLAPAWLGVMAVLQAATLVCLWVLQRLALHVRGWY